MTFLEALIFGVVQGLTEFIPVSSSGHLVILHSFLNTNLQGVSFDVLLHLATLLAVILYFRKDIAVIMKNILNLFSGEEVSIKDKRLIYGLIIATIPAAVLGVFLDSIIEHIFRSTLSVAVALIIGSIVFFVAEKISKEDRTISNKNSFLVGCFQALALVPGVSRSGITISGGLILGLKREEAVRFSFLLSIPIILGAGLVKLMGDSALTIDGPVLTGSLVAFISGLFAIHFLVRFLKNNSLMVFVWYRVALAVALVVFF